MRSRLAGGAVVLSLLVSVVWAAPASAANHFGSKLGFPDRVHNDQRMTVSIGTLTPIEVDYITYRQVSTTHPPAATAACAKTMATNVDSRFFGPKTNHGVLSASVVLPLRPYALCWYSAPGNSLDPSKAVLASAQLAGTYSPGAGFSATKSTSITLKTKHLGSAEVLAGTTTGPASGVVVAQAKVGASWRVVASLPLSHNVFSGAVPAVAGQRLRVYLLPSIGWRASASGAVIG